jgi:hypothetical protein
MKKINIVRYMNAYGYIETKMVQDSTLNRYIKNWGWKYNGDKSGLEIIAFEFESIFKEEFE